MLERQALAPFLQRQHWFASRSMEIRRLRFSDWALTQRRHKPGVRHDRLGRRRRRPAGDATSCRSTLLSGEEAERALKQMPGAVLARITGARKGAIVDGTNDVDSCDRLLALVTGEQEIATPLGTVRGTLLPRAPTGSLESPGNQTVRRRRQTVLKLFRRIEPGPNPEFEIGRALAARGFTRTPALVGALEYDRPGLEPGTLAVVQAVVKHQGSGWEFTLDDLRRYYERVAARVHATGGQDRAALAARHGRGTASADRLRSSPRSSTGIFEAPRCSDAGRRNCIWRLPVAGSGIRPEAAGPRGARMAD